MKLFSWFAAVLKSVKRRYWLKKRHRYRVSWLTSLNVSLLYSRWYHKKILKVIVHSIVSQWRCQPHGCQIRYNQCYHRAVIKKQHFFQKRRMRRFSQQKLAVKPMKRGLLHRQRVKTLEYPEKQYPRSRYIGFGYSRSRYVGFSYLRCEEKKSVPFWIEFRKKIFYRTGRMQCSLLTSLFLLIVCHQLPKKFKLADDSHHTPVIKPLTIERLLDYSLGFWGDDSIISPSSHHLGDLSNPRCNIENRKGHLPTCKNMRVTHMTVQSYSVPPKDENVYLSIIGIQDLAKSIARSSCEVLEEKNAHRWATTAMEIAEEGGELGIKFISWLENEVQDELTERISAYCRNLEHVRSCTDLMVLLGGLETYSLLLNDTSKFKKFSEIASYLITKNDDSREEKREKIRMIMGIDMNHIIDSRLSEIVNSKLDEIIDFKEDKITGSELMAVISDPSPREDEDNFLEGLFQRCVAIWLNDQSEGMTEAEMDIVVYGEAKESNNFVMSKAENWDADTSNFSTSGSQDNSNAVGSNISSYTEQSGSPSSALTIDTSLNKPYGLIKQGCEVSKVS